MLEQDNIHSATGTADYYIRNYLTHRLEQINTQPQIIYDTILFYDQYNQLEENFTGTYNRSYTLNFGKYSEMFYAKDMLFISYPELAKPIEEYIEKTSMYDEKDSKFYTATETLYELGCEISPLLTDS